MEDVPGIFHHLLALNITLQVMAVADMSPGDQDAIRTLVKSVEQKARMDTSRAHQPNQADVGWILQARNPCQVGTGIRAPVAQKSNYPGPESSHQLL